MMSRCSSCGTVIQWRETPQGKRMPVDAGGRACIIGDPGEPQVTLVTAAGEVIRGRGAGPDDVAAARAGTPPPGYTRGQLPHWATCPHAARHRRR